MLIFSKDLGYFLVLEETKRGTKVVLKVQSD